MKNEELEEYKQQLYRDLLEYGMDEALAAKLSGIRIDYPSLDDFQAFGLFLEET